MGSCCFVLKSSRCPLLQLPVFHGQVFLHVVARDTRYQRFTFYLQDQFSDMRISINQTPGSQPDFGFTIRWDYSGIFVASVEKGKLYTLRSFSVVCVGSRSHLIWPVGVGGMWERCISVEESWRSLLPKTSSWSYKLPIVYSPFLICFHFQESLFCDL